MSFSSVMTIKTVYGDDIRRLDIQQSGGLSTLYGPIKEAYGVEEQNILLKYQDEDGDLVTIGSEKDYNTFKLYASQQKKVIKVVVVKKAAPPAPLPVQTATVKPLTADLFASKASAPVSVPVVAPAVPGVKPEAKPTVDANKTRQSIGNGATLEVRVQTPLHPHELVLTSKPYGNVNGWCCDTCDRRGSSNDQSWHCSTCGFDACSYCAQPQLPRYQEKKKAEDKKQQQPDEVLAEVLAVISDPEVRSKLPAALAAGITAFERGSDIKAVIQEIVTVNGLKDNPNVAKLLTYLPRVENKLERLSTPLRVYTEAMPQMLVMLRTLLPAMLPNILQSAEAALRHQLERRQAGETAQDPRAAFRSVFEASPLAGFFGSSPLASVFAQANLDEDDEEDAEDTEEDVKAKQEAATQAGACGFDVSQLGAILSGLGMVPPTATSGNQSSQTGGATGADGGRAHPHRAQRHWGISCDSCGISNFTGTRHKCDQCYNFDLCGECKLKNLHDPAHTFTIVPTRQEQRGWGSGRCGGRWGGRHGGGRRGHHGGFGMGGPLGVLFGGPGVGGGAHGYGGFMHPPPPPPHHHPHGGHPHHPPHHHPHGQRGDWNGWWRPEEPAKPTLSARFNKDVNLADRSEVEANQMLVKTWSVTNDGSAEWPQDTQLIFVRGDRELSLQEQFAVPIAKPNETVEVSAILSTPPRTGRYSALYKLADADRQPFGPRMWVDLLVVAPPQQPEESKSEEEQQIPITAAAAPTAAQEAPAVEEQIPVQHESAETTDSSAVPAVPEPEDRVPTDGVESHVSDSGSNNGQIKRPSVTVHSEDSDSDLEDGDEKFVRIETAPVKQPSPAPSVPASTASTNNTTTSDVSGGSQFDEQLATLQELGFDNQTLNLFLLRQNHGDLQKTITWLAERLR